MSHQHGLSNNGTETTGFTEPDDSDDRVQKESENVVHSRMVSNGRSSRIQDLWGIRLPQGIKDQLHQFGGHRVNFCGEPRKSGGHQPPDHVPGDHQDHDSHDEPCQRRKRDEVVPVSVLYVDVSDQEAHRSIVQVLDRKRPPPVHFA